MLKRDESGRGEAAARAASYTLLDGETRVMVDMQVERPHLILVGGVHVSIPLQAMATQVGFRVSIVDPRAAFASRERFPDVANILHSYPDKALPQLGPGPQHLSRGSNA